MKTQFTSGPWDFSTEPQPNGCPIVGDKKGLMVAMLAHTVKQTNQRETALANAHLIAASPDMYEALESILTGHADLNSEQITMIESVLKKARG